MADEHLLTLLTRGAENWNRWREVEPDSGLDLSNAVLSDVDLNRYNLSGMNLSRAILRNTRLEGANLSRADLSFANLQGARLTFASVAGASFLGANLTGAEISGVNFSDTKLTGATYDQPELREIVQNQSRQRMAQFPGEERWQDAPERRSTPLPAVRPPRPGQFYGGGGPGMGLPMPVSAAGGPSEDFVAVLDGALAPEEVQFTLTALSDYYRKCGGLGFKIRFRLEEAQIEEFSRVR